MVEAMHSIQFSRPSHATKRFVRFYALQQSNLASSVLIYPVPARSEPVLNFQFADEIQIHNLDERVVRLAKTAALIGLQTHRRVERHIRDYRFHDDGTIELGYRKLGYFRHALTGTFLDRATWEEAQLTRGDYSIALIMIDRILKEHHGNPPLEINERLVDAIDRAERQIVPEHMKTLAKAKKLRGICLEARGQVQSALRCYQEALAIDPKSGVKRGIERLIKVVG